MADPGTIIDPQLNVDEKDYGILVDLTTGTNYYYLKDEACQYLTQGTPVDFNLMPYKVEVQNEKGDKHEFELFLAVEVKANEAKIADHTVINNLNGVAGGMVRDNKGHSKGDKNFKLMNPKPSKPNEEKNN